MGIVPVIKMLGRKRIPVFLVRIWAALALNFRDRFLDLPDRFTAPGIEALFVSPAAVDQLFPGDIETIPTHRRLAKSRVDVTCVVVFTVTAKTQQAGDDQLRPVPVTRLLGCFAQD